jgi:hypothetical protein
MSIRRIVPCAIAFGVLGLFIAKVGPDRQGEGFIGQSVALAGPPQSGVGPAAVGDLTGRFVVRGHLPPRSFNSPVLPRTGRRLKDDSLLVFGNDQTIANVFVYMYPTTAVAGQPKYLFESPIGIVISGGRMIPRAVCTQTSQELVIANGDDEASCLRFESGDIAPDTQIGAHESARVTLARSGSQLPSTVDATNVPWLHGLILVSDNPYAAVTDGYGQFTIKNIPVGKWQFAVSHQRLAHVANVVLDGKPTKWEHGRFSWTIHSGVNSLGTVEIPAESLR